MTERPFDPSWPRVDDRRHTDDRLLSSTFMDVAADDQPWPYAEHRVAYSPAAQAPAPRGAIDGPVRRRVADQDAAGRTCGEEHLGLFLSEVVAPGPEWRHGNAAPDPEERD